MNKDRGHKKMPVDDQFINEAWGSMESILDQHMPVNKKRQFIAYWLFAGLLLLGTIGGLSYFGLQESNKEQNAISIIEERNQKELKNPIDNKTAKENNPQAEIVETSNQHNKGDELIQNENFLSGNAGKANVIKPESAVNETILRSTITNEIKFNEIPVILEDEGKSLEAAPAINENPIDSDKLQPPFAMLFEESIEPLPIALLESSALVNEFPSHYNLDVTDPISLPINKLIGGIEVSGGVHLGTKGLTGFAVSTGVDLAVHPKWSVKPELGYARMTTSNPFSMRGSADAEVLFASEFNPDVLSNQDTSGNGVFLGGVNNSTSEVNLSGFHSFTSALLIEYKINRKFSVFGGPSLAYAFSVKASEESLVFETMDVTAAASVVERIIIPVSDGIKRFDPAFTAGIGFSPNDRLSLQLRYNHHFSNLKKTGYFVGTEKLNHSGLRFSLGYTIK